MILKKTLPFVKINALIGALLFIGACSEIADSYHVAEGRLSKGDIHNAKEDTKDALLQYQAGVRNKAIYRKLLVLGWSDFWNENYQRADQAFTAALNMQPKSVRGLLGRGWIMLERNEIGRATGFFKAAEENAVAPNTNPNILLAKGWLAMRLGDHELAKKHFEKASIKSQNKTDMGFSRYSLGQYYFEKTQFDKAITQYQTGIEEDANCFLCYKGLADIALRRGNMIEAQNHLRDALLISAAQPSILQMMHNLLDRFNDSKRTLLMFGRIYGRHKNAPSLHYMAASLLTKQGDQYSAEQIVKELMDIDPYYPGVDKLLETIAARKSQLVTHGWTAYNAGDYQKALILFEQKRHEARQKRNASADDGRGWTLIKLKRYAAAQQAFNDALNIDPHFIRAQQGLDKLQELKYVDLEQSYVLMRQGDLRSSEDAINAARGLLPKKERYLAEIAHGWLFYYSNDFVRASSRFQQLVHLYPQSHEALLGLGMSMIARNRYNEGYGYIRDAVVMNPNHEIEFYRDITTAISQYGTHGQLMPILQIAVDTYPEDGHLSWLAAQTAHAMGNEQAASQYAVMAARYIPEFVDKNLYAISLPAPMIRDAYVYIGLHYYEQGKYDASANSYRSYLTAGGDNLEAIRGYGMALFRSGKPRESIAFLRKAASGEPDKLSLLQQRLAFKDNDSENSFLIGYNATSILGWVYLNLDDPAKAAQYFEFALRDYPELADAWTGLGIAYSRMRNNVRAAQSFERALGIIPNYPEAEKGLAALGVKS